jgi:hypothetical protein
MTTENAAPSVTPGEGGGSLKILSGPSLQTGAEIILIDARITLGSDPAKVSVVLANDIKVSRLHAFIQREGEAYMLYDAESVSGTLVNGAAITRGHPLMPGDRIQIGDTVMSFSMRRAWSSQPTSVKGLMAEVMAVAVILLFVAILLFALNSKDAEELDMSGWNVDTAKPLVPRDADGNIDWRSSSFVMDLASDLEKAQMHYRRGMRCHDDVTLDPANAFSAILELRRAKAYAYEKVGKADLGFQIDKADAAIEDCQKYLQNQQERYVRSFKYARGINDAHLKMDCLQRLAAMFRDRFGDARCKERVTYETALASL